MKYQAVMLTLLAGFAVLLAQTWAGLGRPLVDVATRSRLAQEAHAAAAALACDLCGSLANNEGRLGRKTAFRLVGRMQPGNSQLWLCFDGGLNPNGLADWGPPDTVISYQVAANTLVRWDQTAGSTVTVARYVDQLELTDLGGQVQIQLTFRYRGIMQTYTMIARDP